MIEEPATTLDSLEPGQCGRFTRISDHDPEMLRYLADRGIAPGDDFEVMDKQPFGGPLFVRFGEGDVQVVGGLLAAAMRVEERAA
jgi:DtxR family Mn-dependent transcriptional regulator